jgi:hypothetical protein
MKSRNVVCLQRAYVSVAITKSCVSQSLPLLSFSWRMADRLQRSVAHKNGLGGLQRHGYANPLMAPPYVLLDLDFERRGCRWPYACDLTRAEGGSTGHGY